MKFQRKNPYNQFLPYVADIEEDAEKYLAEIKANLRAQLKTKIDLVATDKWMTNLQKYIALYGFRFSLKDHIWFIKVLYGVLTCPNVDPLSLDKYGKLLICLVKKKYLLSNANLILDWKPLYKLLHRYEDSSEAARGLLKSQSGLKATLRTVVKFTRSFFSHESTQEMLDEWRPTLCPFDRSMIQGMKYLSLFLPTTSSIPSEKGWKLWLEEFFVLWSSFSNSPSWEVELFTLYTRLAFHNTGRIDWTPYVEQLFTKFMVALNLPVTYGQSGVKVKFGLSESGSFPYISRWIVSALGGPQGKIVQAHLDKMLLAIESYYHPANANVASEALHHFIHNLCSGFIYRLHLERYNEKWESKTPVDKRLTDEEVEHFIKSLLPIVFHILYNPYEEERKSIFNTLATIRPDLIIPPLLERLQNASESLTEPHRFTACLATLSACSRPLVENYPLDVIKVLTVIVPGININDIWKSTDIFILLSDLLEMIWLIDFSHPAARAGVKTTEDENELLCQTALFDDFVLTFTDHCLTMLENSSREQISHDADVMEDSLNEEELAADAAITETFQKLVARVSLKSFNAVLDKLKRYTQSHILEPAVAGAIFASMVKGMTAVRPEQTLEFFLPHLCTRIEAILGDRSTSSDNQKVDKELQFNILMLSEVVSVKMLSVLPQRPSNMLLKHIERLCHVFDKILVLDLKDEYEMASNALENVLFNIVHVRPLQNYYASLENPVWSKEEFTWGKSVHLEDMKVEWYIPSKSELEIVQMLYDKYFQSQLRLLDEWVGGQKELEKEEILRTLRQIYKIIHGSSELMPSLTTKPSTTCASQSLKSLASIQLTFKNGQSIRQSVLECMQKVQKHLLASTPDDTDSLNAVIAVYEVLLFSFGLDEDELNDHMEEHRTIKMHRLNKLVSSKKHLINIHIDRICVQHETQVWLKNFLLEETLPKQVVKDVFELSVSHYGEVRSYAQDLLLKIVVRVIPESHDIVLPLLAESLKPDVSHQQFKGALYILSMEKFGFFYSWKSANMIMPALVEAQHSDKLSIVELLKDFSIKCNRSYSDFALYTLPCKAAILSEDLLKNLGMEENFMEVDDNLEDEHFLMMEKRLCELVQGGNLHWRHYQMAIGMLLSMIVSDHKPPASVVRMWMECLLHDDITIRFIAFQAMECILKLYKVKRKKVEQDPPALVGNHPGIREDNLWLQYNSNLTTDELAKYWTQPFCVKPEMGFYTWPKPKVKLRVVDDTELVGPVSQVLMDFFKDSSKLNKFIELNTIEIKKGEDIFNMDKALFYCGLFEQLGPQMLSIFVPYVQKFCSSSEESEQRCAAEIVFGMIKGSRFWSFEPVNQLWTQVLVPSFRTILSNVTTETLQDWELCLSGATNKHDSNRLRWLFDLLIDQSKLSSSTMEGAFSQASYLKLLNKSIVQNWKLKELFNQTFDLLKHQCSHPYNKVRYQISSIMATALSLDIKYGQDQTMGTGYPKVKDFLDFVMPKLTLNFHNPVLNGHVRQNGVVDIDETSSSSSVMDVDNNGEAVSKAADHSLETMALWVSQYIQSTSTSLRQEVYELLPFFCQFVGNETGNEVSQTCLKALCFLSVCITPKASIDFALEMIWKVSQSSSWKAKMSILEFAQTFVFTNFMSLCLHEKFVTNIEGLVTSLMSDVTLQVRQKATKILCGLFHSQFISKEGQVRLLKEFRGKIRKKMTKKSSNKFKKEKPRSLANLDKAELATFHSGILGLTAIVEAYPYDVPEMVPDILVELEKHLHDPQPIPKTIKDCFQEFKRTHQDNWQEHKLKFSEDQLGVMTDLLVSPNYYA